MICGNYFRHARPVDSKSELGRRACDAFLPCPPFRLPCYAPPSHPRPDASRCCRHTHMHTHSRTPPHQTHYQRIAEPHTLTADAYPQSTPSNSHGRHLPSEPHPSEPEVATLLRLPSAKQTTRLARSWSQPLSGTLLSHAHTRSHAKQAACTLDLFILPCAAWTSSRKSKP